MKPTSTSKGYSNLAISLAKVTKVYPEDLRCSLKVIGGEDNAPPYDGVELFMPSIGARHFLGGIPEVGDFCLCGWSIINTGKAGQKTPIILAWLPRSTFLGHEWLPAQDFAPEDGVVETPKDQREMRAEGAARVRHKLRYYNEGNVGASSSQGADLVLDESVLLSNRRANEIILRDQDQAIVMRSLQQFHALAGARVYGGMVQRDARTLPNEMFTSDIVWASDTLFDEAGNLFIESREGSVNDLEPHTIFQVDSEGQSQFEKGGGRMGKVLNPYLFLYDAKLIDAEGKGKVLSGGETYGGKSILRVASSGQSVEESKALVEYRIEVNHTDDGTLPVTEQTDGFEADRLLSPQRPLAEFVMGTAVGNDPHSDEGIGSYGKPLVFDVGEDGAISLVSSDADTLLGDQLATLLTVRPTVEGLTETFLAVSKAGSMTLKSSSIAEDSLRLRSEGGVKVSSVGVIDLEAPQLKMTSTTPVEGEPSIDFSTTGAVRIVSQGAFNPAESAEGLEGYDPSLSRLGVDITSTETVKVSSAKAVVLSSPKLVLQDSSSMTVGSQNSFDLSAGDQIAMRTKQFKNVVTGKHETVISGPTDFNMLSGSPREVTVAASPATGFAGGVADKYTLAYGDRLSTYATTSNVSTVIASGSHNVTVTTGTAATVAGATAITQSPAGVSISAGAGTVSINATAGAISLNSSAKVSVTAVASIGLTGASISLKAPSSAVGAVMCAGDRDPTTGKTFLESGFIIPPRGVTLGV